MTSQDSSPRADDAAGRLRELVRGATPREALAFYDALPAVPVERMLGSWAGSELPTGHDLDGLLAIAGWHGKRFEGPDAVHPLVMDDGRSLNPVFAPLPLLLRHHRIARRPGVAGAVRPLRRLIATTRPKARLRATQYRGVVTATMCYDDLPVHDVFRGVDADTVLGAMDMPGMAPYLFVLRRED